MRFWVPHIFPFRVFIPLWLAVLIFPFWLVIWLVILWAELLVFSVYWCVMAIAHRNRPRRSHASLPPISPDGRWVWDGQAWHARVMPPE